MSGRHYNAGVALLCTAVFFIPVLRDVIPAIPVFTYGLIVAGLTLLGLRYQFRSRPSLSAGAVVASFSLLSWALVMIGSSLYTISLIRSQDAVIFILALSLLVIGLSLALTPGAVKRFHDFLLIGATVIATYILIQYVLLGEITVYGLAFRKSYLVLGPIEGVMD